MLFVVCAPVSTAGRNTTAHQPVPIQHQFAHPRAWLITVRSPQMTERVQIKFVSTHDALIGDSVKVLTLRLQTLIDVLILSQPSPARLLATREACPTPRQRRGTGSFHQNFDRHGLKGSRGRELLQNLVRDLLRREPSVGTVACKLVGSLVHESLDRADAATVDVVLRGVGRHPSHHKEAVLPRGYSRGDVLPQVAMGKAERTTTPGDVLKASFRKSRVREHMGRRPCDPSDQHPQSVDLCSLRRLAGARKRSVAVLRVAVPRNMPNPALRRTGMAACLQAPSVATKRWSPTQCSRCRSWGTNGPGIGKATCSRSWLCSCSIHSGLFIKTPQCRAIGGQFATSCLVQTSQNCLLLASQRGHQRQMCSWSSSAWPQYMHKGFSSAANLDLAILCCVWTAPVRSVRSTPLARCAGKPQQIIAFLLLSQLVVAVMSTPAPA